MVEISELICEIKSDKEKFCILLQNFDPSIKNIQGFCIKMRKKKYVLSLRRLYERLCVIYNIVKIMGK